MKNAVAKSWQLPIQGDGKRYSDPPGDPGEVTLSDITITEGVAAGPWALTAPTGYEAPFSVVVEGANVALPGHLSIVGSNLVYDHTAEFTPGVTQHKIVATESLPDAEADWLERSTASGVFFANNMSRFADSDDLRADSWSSSGDGSNRDYAENLHLDTTTKLSGPGSCRIHITTQGVSDQGNYRQAWTGINGDKSLIKTALYYQFAVYTDARLLTTYLGAGSGSRGNKLMIIFKVDNSFATGEIVATNRRFSGFVTGYTYQSGIYHFFSDETDSPMQWVPDGWTVIETYQNKISGRVAMWAAQYGQAPIKLMDVNLSINYPDIYSGVQMTNYDTQGWDIMPPGIGDRTFGGQAYHTFHCYDELIASDDWIPFPGHLDQGEF